MKLKHYEIFFNDKTLPVYSTFPYRQPLGEATVVMVNLERVNDSMSWLELHIPDLDLPGETERREMESPQYGLYTAM